MNAGAALERLHANRWLVRFTWAVRILLAIAFLPSGATKLLGNRFTLLGTDTAIGYFFEALYRTGFYWRFIGGMQVAAALLLLAPRTATLGALLYFPIVLNVCLITWALHFRGTVVITSLMLLASVYLLAWDYDRWRAVLPWGAGEQGAREEEPART